MNTTALPTPVTDDPIPFPTPRPSRRRDCHASLMESLAAGLVARPALMALSLRLEAMGYSQHAREGIVTHAATEGTPTGSADLDPADEAVAEDAFVSGFEPVPFDDPAWSCPADDAGPAPQPPSAADWEDYYRHRDVIAGRAAAARASECLHGYE